MEATERTEKIARDMISLLAENNCTVKEAQEVMQYVHMSILNFSVVQKTSEKLFKTEGN